jgi:hypothetical protein
MGDPRIRAVSEIVILGLIVSALSGVTRATAEQTVAHASTVSVV